MTNTSSLYNRIFQEVKLLKRELDRLTVRESAIERLRKAIEALNLDDASEMEIETNEDIVSNIDAIGHDLSTFKSQMRDRLNHVEHGVRIASLQSDEVVIQSFYQYILDEVLLCVRDARVAREGYDELINNLNELIEMRGL